MVEADEVLDCSGLMCPMPVLKAKQVMSKIESGKLLRIIATDKGSREDIPAWAESTGNELLEMKEEEDKIVFIIKKK